MSCKPATTHRYEYDGQRRICKRCGDVFPADAALTPPREPQTAAGRALLSLMVGYDWPNDSASYVLAIEAEAAGTPLREALASAIDDTLGPPADGISTATRRAIVDLALNRAALAATPAPAPLDVEAVAAELCVNRPTCLTHRAQAQAAVDAMARLAARAAAAEDTDAQ